MTEVAGSGAPGQLRLAEAALQGSEVWVALVWPGQRGSVGAFVLQHTFKRLC